MRLAVPFLVILLSGCATGRTVLDVNAPTAEALGEQAVAFKVVSIDDARTFELKPRQANIPSLRDGDIGNAATKARAIGRKRGPFGGARGDYVVPESSSVAKLVQESVATALVRAGGVLVKDGDPRFAAAIPLQLRIDRFWSWLRPGAWAVQAEFDVQVMVSAPLAGLESGKAVAGHAELRKGAMTDARWRTVVESGLSQFTDELAKAMAPIIAAADVATSASGT